MAPASSGPLPGAGMPEIDQLRATVGEYFPVYETRVTPHSLVLLVHADPATLEERFDTLRRTLWDRFYIPQIRLQQGEYAIEIVRRMPRRRWSGVVNLVLLALTAASTAAAGAFLWLSYRGGASLTLSDFGNGALFFAAPLMAALGLHELAHYVVARRHHVEGSLPYFIPVPPPYFLFGTFGALISLREPIPSKKALLDIGAAGPLAGFAVSVPLALVGLFLSAHAPVLPLTNCGPTILGANYGNLIIGDSAIFYGLSLFVPTTIVNLHPLAIAGWVGLLVTSMNLLPAGQLDGGHVFRALFGERARYVSWAAVLLLFGLGIFYLGWIFFGLLILFLGFRHPPPLNDLTRLDARRWGVGAAALAILVAGFVIVPIATPTGAFGVPVRTSAAVTPPPGSALADRITLTIHNLDLVAHGYSLTGVITQVTVNTSGSNRTLTGPELQSFEANGTWTLLFPNGTSETFSGGSSWAMAPGEYVQANASARSTVLLDYTNTGTGYVHVEIAVSELCEAGLDQRYSFILG